MTTLSRFSRFGVALTLVLVAGAAMGFAVGLLVDDDEPGVSPTACQGGNAQGPPAVKRVRPKVVLQPDATSQTRTINFGEDRDPEAVTFGVDSDRRLEPDVVQRLSLTPETFIRTGNEAAESVTFPEPEVSELDRKQNRRGIRFTVCLNPAADLPAGQYAGSVLVEGPPGVEGTVVTIAANAKDRDLFVGGLIITLILALLVLLYQGAAGRRRTSTEPWGPAFRATGKDLGWFAPTLFALGAAGGTLFGLYTDDPAWGADGLSSVASLIGAGLAAVGAKAIFSSAASPVGEQPGPTPGGQSPSASGRPPL